MNTLDKVGGLIIDMDGVLWHGSHPVAGLLDFFDLLRQLSMPFVLATNNASLTQQQYVDKLAGFGVSVSAEEVFTSSMATAQYLVEQLDSNKRRAYVIGEQGLTQPLQQAGFVLTDLYQIDQPDKGIINQGADIVVSGLDRKLSWDKLATATLNIRAGAKFYATNADVTLPTELGQVMGNGGVIAALKAATGVEPVVIGKPQAIFYQQALALLDSDHSTTIAIGDRLNTDILGAINAGMRSIMVLTGVSTTADLHNIDYAPTWVVKDISEIGRLLKNCR